MKPFTFSRIIDLSQTLYSGMPSWQTNPDLQYGPIQKAVKDIFNLSVITKMCMHTGAHVDAPLHSIQEGKTIDQFSIEEFVGEGVVLDFRDKKPGAEITREDFAAFDREILKDEVVMLCTDWSNKRGFNGDYLYKWPFPNLEACNYLVDKGIKAIGTEGLSIAGWGSTVPAQGPVTKISSASIHNIFLEKEIPILEGAANLSEILQDKNTARAFFVFAPLNFVGVEGSPCRAFALI
jgi:arylformamidase